MAGELRQARFEQRIIDARSGLETEDESRWYDRYIASGSPEKATSMITRDVFNAAPTSSITEEFLTGLRGINSAYYKTQEYDPNGPDRQMKYDKGTERNAQRQVKSLLDKYGIKKEDMRNSVRGSSNDTFLDLGVGNQLYTADGDYRQRDYYRMQDSGGVGTFASGEDNSGGVAGSMFGNILAGALAIPTGGWSIVAQQAMRAAEGDTLHGEDYAKAALAVATPLINKGFAGKIGDVGFNWGEGVQAGAASGATSAALEGALTGDLNLKDIARGGLMGGATAGAKDFLQDTLHTGSRQGLWDEAVAKGITGEGNIREYIARNLNTSDFGKLVGPDSLLGGSEFDTGWLNDGINAVGKGAEALGIDRLLDPLLSGGKNAYTGNKAFQESKAAVDEAQRQLGNANDQTRAALTENLDVARTQHQFNVDQIQQGEIRYDERFLTDSDDKRGDSPLFGITRENPFGGGTGTTAGEGSADSVLPTQDTSKTPITDNILGLVGGGDGSGTQAGAGGGPSDNTQLPTQDNDLVLQDQILEAIAAEEDPLVRQGMQDDLLALEGDGDLMGTNDPFADPQGSGVGEGNLTLGGYDGALPPVGNEDVLPPTGDTSLPPVSDEDLPPSGADNLPAGTPKRIRKVAKQLDDELFRLARVMQVLPMNELQKVSLQQRMREIQGQRQSLAYDATAVLDPQSTEYIQKVKEGEEDASNIIDPIQEAIEATA